MATILIYDVSEEGRRTIKETIGIRSEWKLVEASSSDDAIERLDRQPIDLIVIDTLSLSPPADPLLDWMHTNMSDQLPIVLLTPSEGGAHTNVEALLLGAASYVPRSVIARDLVVTLERILTLAGCRRRHARLLDALQATESKFTLEDNDLELVPVLVRHLADMCDEFSVCGNGSRLRTSVALEEAMSNGIIHGNLEVPSALREENDSRFHELIRTRRSQYPFRRRKLSVLGMFTAGEAQFTIRDEGPGFDPSLIPDPTQMENLDKPHGRGLFLIRAFMDEVSFNDRGNEIHLVKCATSQNPRAPDVTRN